MDGNIQNLRDVLEWTDRRIREEAKLDGEMSLPTCESGGAYSADYNYNGGYSE